MVETADFRDATVDDAAAVNALFIDRYDEIIPGCQDWKAKRIRRLKEYGTGYFAILIDKADLMKGANFAQVATVDDEVVGFAYATCDARNQRLARLGGLVVSRDYGHQGFGVRLEVEREAWADLHNRVLYGRIVAEDPVMEFYKHRGYREVGTGTVAAGTLFRRVEHTPPNTEPLSSDVIWGEVPTEEPFFY